MALNCPHSVANAPGSPGAAQLSAPTGPTTELFWQQMFMKVSAAVEAMQRGDMFAARLLLADMLASSTDSLAPDPTLGFTCSLGVAAAYRLLAMTFFGDTRMSPGSRLFRRAHQIALRFQHMAMVWVTHVWEKFARREEPLGSGNAWYDAAYIDESVWPITLRDINVEMSMVQNTLADAGRPLGHEPRWREAPHDFRDPNLRIGIISLCAYPSGHVLPRYAASNHRIYAARHGYRYHVGEQRMDPKRPHAWGKIKLMYQALHEPDVDWWLWFDCDTFFMNMTITLDHLLHKYGQDSTYRQRLDPDFHMLVAEDHAMLNTGAFFLRASDWSRETLRRVWGPDNSVWSEHPWWENAAIIWQFLKDNSEQYRGEKAGASSALPDNTRTTDDVDEMEGIYPKEVRLAPQFEFNSYHPATSQFLHDTWAPEKFALAFNGVLSATSQSVVASLYARYYELSCELNSVTDQCEEVDEVLPWLARGL